MLVFSCRSSLWRTRPGLAADSDGYCAPGWRGRSAILRVGPCRGAGGFRADILRYSVDVAHKRAKTLNNRHSQLRLITTCVPLNRSLWASRTTLPVINTCLCAAPTAFREVGGAACAGAPGESEDPPLACGHQQDHQGEQHAVGLFALGSRVPYVYGCMRGVANPGLPCLGGRGSASWCAAPCAWCAGDEPTAGCRYGPSPAAASTRPRGAGARAGAPPSGAEGAHVVHLLVDTVRVRR